MSKIVNIMLKFGIIYINVYDYVDINILKSI